MSLEICRICGSKENLKHVFREGTDELLDKIRLCANIHIDAVDSLPKFVCNACEHGLDFSYRLRKRGEETEKMLRQELLGPTKREHSTSVEDDEKGDAVNGGIDGTNEELWIKEEHNEHFDEESIDHVKEETSPMKQSCDETEEWLTMPDEDISDTDEIIVNGSVGHIKVEPMIDQGESCSSMIEELDQTDSQFSFQKSMPTKARAIQIECENCAEVFPTRCKYFEHIKEHGDKRFHCSVCDKWFSRKYMFNQHMKNHSSVTSAAFPCEQCSKSYTNYWNLARHTRSAHSGERKFHCSQCDASFSRADVLKMHMTKHSNVRNIECDLCHKKFKTTQNLFFHKRCHLDKSERPKKPPGVKSIKIEVFLCDFCQKVSHHRTTHLNHIRTHTGEKPYECSYCEKSFRTSSARRNHLLTHTDERPYQCKLCNLSFRQNSHLKSHMLIHDGVKRYVCDFCQKAFTMKSNLMVHLRTHTGEMPYECNKCPKKFVHLNQVKRHKMSHVSDGTSHANETETEDFKDSQISLYADEMIEMECTQDETDFESLIENCT